MESAWKARSWDVRKLHVCLVDHVLCLLSFCVAVVYVCGVGGKRLSAIQLSSSSLSWHCLLFSLTQVVRANMDSPTVAAATEGGSPFYKIYEIYLVR